MQRDGTHRQERLDADVGLVVEARLVNGTSVQRDGTRRQERLDADVDCPALDRVSSPMQFCLRTSM